MALPSTTPDLLGEAGLDAFDVCIVGTGAGGAAAAWVLCREGLRVVMLEAGNNYFPGLDDPADGMPIPLFSNDELKMGPRRMIGPDPLVDPRTFRASPADGPRSFVGDVNGLPRCVGGAAVHADMKYPRFQPFDFRLGSMLGEVPGTSFADWPIDYDALAPFYAEAEVVTGVQGLMGSDPFEPPRSRDYPMPPGLPMYAATILGDAARRLGYAPFPYPTAVTSRRYRGRPACIDCGFCSGFGCPNNAKGSPAVTFLREALLTGRCQVRFNATAVRLVSNAGGTAIDAIEYVAPDGTMEEVRADRFVLAASAIESARLCLLSGVGNSSDQIGRNLMFHFQTIVVGVLRERVHGHRGRSVTHALTELRGVPGDPARPLGGIIELSTASDLLDEIGSYAFALGARSALLKALVRASPFRDKLVALIMQAEDAPQPGNRADLDPEVRDLNGRPVARVTYSSHAFELSARERAVPLLLDVMREAGAQFGIVAPVDAPSQSRHLMGTMRMGDDPRTSVCDRTGKLHDLGNVFCADGGLFPTGSGYNPTLTIHALALRVAAEMVYPGTPERVLRESV